MIGKRDRERWGERRLDFSHGLCDVTTFSERERERERESVRVCEREGQCVCVCVCVCMRARAPHS